MDDAVSQIVAVLLAQGPIGVFCAYLMYQSYQKDKRIEELTDRAAQREVSIGATLVELKSAVQSLGLSLGGKA